MGINPSAEPKSDRRHMTIEQQRFLEIEDRLKLLEQRVEWLTKRKPLAEMRFG